MTKARGWLESWRVNRRMGLSQLNAMQERVGGLAGWLMRRLRAKDRMQPRLLVLERVTLGPRQSLALVEADGSRILVAIAAEGGPAFFPLPDSGKRMPGHRASRVVRAS
jgi:Flagellar biosynthesis protein, FliO